LMYAYDGAGSSDGEREIDNQDFFIKLGRKIIGSLDRIDADGFVFRTDLRLRPNGDSGPLVLSFAAMEHYYQTHGRNWERYALIKARVVAGDRQSGAQLLRMLKPFVYRKYLDFSAFDSIREMKTLIERQLESSGAKGDVKLGRGGIREIEFLVQNHQLIRGGREKNLQTTSLYVAMQQMVELGVLDKHAHDLLLDAYRFLRNVEHRLQMVADRQTQKLPQEVAERARLAMAMGFEEWQQFVEQLDLHRENVHRLFGEVLESPQQSAATPEISRLEAVWQGQLDKAQAQDELASTGFKQPDNIPGLLEQFRAGSLYRAFSSIERDRLDRLMPLVLKQAGSHSEAERTLTSFIAMVEAIGRRSVYISLLIENPIALKQLLHLCAASPWISRHIGQHPVVLDELLQPLAGAEPQSKQQVIGELSHRLDQVEPGDVEAQMNALREFYHAQVLRIAAADVGQQIDGDQIERGLTQLAEVILQQVLHDAVGLIENKQGPPPGDVGVIAYGKFAGQELGYHSDLDIVVCFEPSSSASPAEAEYYFSRVGQRLINLLTTRTAAGTLYELDMRLRPSGRSGTLVTSLKAFEEYQLKNAWTWEHQALVRARMVVGGVGLVDRFETIRRQVLCASREPQKLKSEIVDMRRRMVDANCKSDARQFDIKLDYGGIVDVEFLVQYLVLVHAAEYPQIIEPRNTQEIIQCLAENGLLDSKQARLLSENYRQFLQRSLELKLMDRQVMISQQELVTEREQVMELWQATFY
ncbi:MAG: bifunctional [glutamate--ammonia ligase]-adenylyl-L-tyrosine phosphorylase/[glutamate--ammonia-ligase] adenylyltransferase, partial [Gammaproteobacteria bacterium]